MKSIILILLSVFVLFATLLHFVHPEINPLQYPLSWYLALPKGWLLKIALLSFGLAEILMGITLPRIQKHTRILFIIAGIGAALAGIFSIDHDKLSVNITERIHIYGAAIQFMVYPFVLFSVWYSKSFKKRGIYLVSAIISMFLFMVIVVILSIEKHTFLSCYGLLQRIDILIITVCNFVFAGYISRRI